MVYLILIPSIQYLLTLIAFLYGFVTPSHVCYVSGLPPAFLFCLKKDVAFLKRRVLVSPSHVCYVSGLPQAFVFSFFLKTTCLFEKMCFLPKTDIFDKYLSIFDNICQYLSMYLPTVRYCVLYGTAYLPTCTVRY